MIKEEILERLQKDSPHSIPVFKAMDEYAKQQSVAFNKWFIMYKTEKLSNCAGNKDEYKKWALMPIEDYYDIFLDCQRLPLFAQDPGGNFEDYKNKE